MKTIVALVACAGCAVGAQAATIKMQHLKTIDVSEALAGSSSTNTKFIGNKMSTVAWNGSDLFIGGFNNGGAGVTGIAKVSNALGAHSIGNAFGQVTTGNSLGTAQMAIKGNTLAVGLDLQAGSGDSVRAFNVNDNTLRWRIGTAAADSTRRGSAVGFDGDNVAYLSVGGGRRHRLDATTGAYINGQNAGAIINFPTTATSWRGMAFDSNGDLYTRESNRLGKHTRTGDNSFSPNSILTTGLPVSIAPPPILQQLELVNSLVDGKFIILNDRFDTTAGRAFTDVVKAFDLNGVAQTLDFQGFSALGTNAGVFSFSFDATSQTLAVGDFANNAVYIFQVPTPGALALLGLGGLVAGRRRR